MELVGTFKLIEVFVGLEVFQNFSKSPNSFWTGAFFPDEASKDLSFEPTFIQFALKYKISQVAEGGHPDQPRWLKS